MYSTFKKGHTYNIQAHKSIHMCMYVYVFACMWVIFGACMCMYEVICCAYISCLCYIACICLYFLQPKLLVEPIHAIQTHTCNITDDITDIHTHTYKNTCKYMQKYIHKTSAQKVHMMLIKCYICMYLYVCVLHVCYM